MTDRQKIDLVFGDYVSKDIRNLTIHAQKLCVELIAKGYVRYILDKKHVEFVKYPKDEKKGEVFKNS